MYVQVRPARSMTSAWPGIPDARFGMFIHWGLYAIPARGEWVRSVEEMPKEDYMPFFTSLTPWTLTPSSGPAPPKRPA